MQTRINETPDAERSIDPDQRPDPAICYAAVMEADEHLPGEPARRSGRYVELNVFGTETGRVAHAEAGEHLPGAPRGFTWRFHERCDFVEC